MKWMNEWMSEWVNEWMHEWMNRWMNEWVIEWMRFANFSTFGRSGWQNGHETVARAWFRIKSFKKNSETLSFFYDHDQCEIKLSLQSRAHCADLIFQKCSENAATTSNNNNTYFSTPAARQCFSITNHETASKVYYSRSITIL